MPTVLDPLWLPPASFEVPTELATHLHADGEWRSSRRRENLPHDHMEGIMIPRAKLRADLLKTVDVHKEQRSDRHTVSVL